MGDLHPPMDYLLQGHQSPFQLIETPDNEIRFDYLLKMWDGDLRGYNLEIETR